MSISNVEMSINDITKVIFKDNVNDQRIFLDIANPDNNVQTPYDLFLFCVDLLCKGLVLLYGDNTNNKVEIEKLSMEQVYFVQKKLKNAGFIMNFTVKDVSVFAGQGIITIPPCIVKNGDSSIEEYALRIVSSNKEYTVTFSLGIA